MCIYELKEFFEGVDHKIFSPEYLLQLYEVGTVQLFSVIVETKKTLPIFQPLIYLGIMFQCFIYLKAIGNKDSWITCIQRVVSNIQSKTKQVMERKDPDIRVFVETAKCIFQVETMDLDSSFLFGEDEDDFFPTFNRKDSYIYIEGLASLFHTGNVVIVIAWSSP